MTRQTRTAIAWLSRFGERDAEIEPPNFAVERRRFARRSPRRSPHRQTGGADDRIQLS
jgi:hypothetical protein